MMTMIPKCPECNCELTPSDPYLPPNMWHCWNGCGRAWYSDESKKGVQREDVYSFIFRYAPREDQQDAPDSDEFCAWIIEEE